MSISTLPMTMQDGSEVVDYDRRGIPLYIRDGKIHEQKVLPHWHDDIELILMLEGEMLSHVNRREIFLKSGDALFTNSRQMHFNESIQNREGKYICILAHPKLLAPTAAMQKKFIQPIIENPALDFIHWKSGEIETEAVAKILKEIFQSKQENQIAYEISCCGLLQQLWQKIYQRGIDYSSDAVEISDLQILRDMLGFIYQNYSQKIFLDDISRAGQICRSKCCQIFKQFMKQSPIDFVNSYRLAVSCQLLKNSKLSITQISSDVGFIQPSYFGKLFQRAYGCSPHDYRRRSIENERSFG